MNSDMDNKIDFIVNEVGSKSIVIVKEFVIGKEEGIEAALIYVNGIVDKNIIDRDILEPLMLHVHENITLSRKLPEYICKKYITASNVKKETDIIKVIDGVKVGKTAILIDKIDEYIIVDTTGGNQRAISDSENESAVRGSRDGFVENLETNISLLKRKIKDKNLVVETFNVGERTKTEVVLIYIKDIVDSEVLQEVRHRTRSVDVDFAAGMLEQYIEDDSYSIFPQVYGTERPDIVKANIMEGRIAILIDGTPYVHTVPAIFVEFFQAVEDYFQRTIVASFARLLRILAVVIVITAPSIYLSLIYYNAELIPVKFINPIVQSREGIALTPFLEILLMEVVIEFLREGGLRLPPKIAGTLSIVGGIIIGNTAIESKIVSPTTLLVVGVSVIASFLIPNYDMSLSIRFIRFPMLILANAMGLLGIVAGSFFLLIHLCSLESFNVPYFSIKKSDIKDIFTRAPLWKMNKRPEAIPNNNPIRQSDFRNKARRNNDE